MYQTCLLGASVNEKDAHECLVVMSYQKHTHGQGIDSHTSWNGSQPLNTACNGAAPSRKSSAGSSDIWRASGEKHGLDGDIDGNGDSDVDGDADADVDAKLVETVNAAEANDVSDENWMKKEDGEA